MSDLKLRIGTLGAIAILLLAGCAPQAATPASTATSPASPTNPSSAPAAAPTSTSAEYPAATGLQPYPAATSTGATNSSQSGAITYTVVADKSEARYRVREQLAQRDLPSDAIGKTSQISGSVTVLTDGSIDASSSKITVDITNLTSDASMRDNFLRRSILNTSTYPNVVFVPTQIEGLPSPLPQSGQVTFKLTGNLTIKDVTKPVTWDVTGAINDDTATGTAKTTFKFEDFNLQQPKVPVVLSVEDNITLELDITLQRAAR
jgi:polyisoprenoid-binding protein YceI